MAVVARDSDRATGDRGDNGDVRRAGMVLAVGLAAAGIAALSWLGSDSLADTAAVVQTAGVLIGVTLAVATLRGDRRDKQVDRVLELHREWMSGDLHDARIRLHEHLRWDDGTGDFRILPFSDLRRGPTREKYPAGTPSTPIQDAGIILRFFERANAARAAGAVHQQLFFRLVARHAAWWNLAIDDGSGHSLGERCVSSWSGRRATGSCSAVSNPHIDGGRHHPGDTCPPRL
jgi:hypothetical protein